MIFSNVIYGVSFFLQDIFGTEMRVKAGVDTTMSREKEGISTLQASENRKFADVPVAINGNSSMSRL